MAELASAERFVVWSFRRWVFGLRENDGGQWSFVRSEFTRQLGAHDGTAALTSFAGLIRCLQCHARRTVQLHQPCCPCLCADEVWIICLVAACQSRQHRLARSLVEWMVEPDGAGEMLEAGSRLAELMCRHALTLPTRGGEIERRTGTAWPPEAARPTLH